jgi:hypothetical protein
VVSKPRVARPGELPYVHRFTVIYTESVASENLKYDLACDEHWVWDGFDTTPVGVEKGWTRTQGSRKASNPFLGSASRTPLAYKRKREIEMWK